MSYTEELDLGSTPSDEDCAQVGSDGYAERAYKECRAYKEQLLRMLSAAGKTRAEGLRILVKSHPHDYGNYYSVVAKFKSDDMEAADQAFWLENSMPEKWDDMAVQQLAPILFAVNP